jgi:hypothetical protein
MSGAISFASPSMRASQSDLTVSISPLGLVELADEEFEVHGPRLNRYSQNFAYYLGHHWGYRREAGESQITFNYVKAFADYINNFTFGRGVHFKSVKEYEHITPALLKRAWEVDNHKQQLLWEMGQQGGVSGDCFVKVAYAPAFVDDLGQEQPGRIRILPLNAAFCFPEWHPHDRDRLIRFKLKYRFWSTGEDGTRSVYTYVEVLTDQTIEEYLNDELIDSRPNPLGAIPIAHIPNTQVSGSPWGLSDIGDILNLNREYNEKATDVSDIINYHAAPVTIITGAKASNLEKGPRKVWGGLPKDASVFNLENGVDLDGPLKYLEMLKRGMHELTGVPETALGQMQAVSNTSGVALAIQYQPMMQRYMMKTLQYSVGLSKINEMVLKTLFIFEPQTVYYDPNTDGIIKPDQPPMVDVNDPLAYLTECEWPAPLPIDTLVKLNEIQAKMALGLESIRGALHTLGEEFPDEKAREIFEEQVEDAKQQGALRMLKAQIDSSILQLTGMPPEGVDAPAPQTDAAGNPVGPQPGGPSPVTLPGGIDLGAITASEIQKMTNEIVTQAYGPRAGLRRDPEVSND